MRTVQLLTVLELNMVRCGNIDTVNGFEFHPSIVVVTM